jgi:hypothetical protein
MSRKSLAVTFIVTLFAALAVNAQPFAAGLQTPARMTFTQQGNIVVAESGTAAPNSGRISLIDRTSGARRTLIDGMPSGISGSGAEAAPSGPSAVAVQSTTVYVTIGAGDGVKAGPATGTEIPNDSPSSPIISSLLSLQLTTSLDIASGGFSLLPSDHARLKNGETVTLTNASGNAMQVRLVADFPNYTPAPRPDFQQNVRAGNPFGLAVRGATAFVVDASQNLIRRVDLGSGAFTTLTTFASQPNPLPFGPPFIDAVPDSVTLRGDELLVTNLTGFPFPQGGAQVRRVNINSGETSTLATGLTSAIDVQPLGSGANDPVLALEFSTNMTESAPGRLRMLTSGGASTTIAENLPTPTSIAVDQRSGDIFIVHIFPGLITRVNAAGVIPAAPPTAIIPAVASQPGAFGSRFTTSMQISNPHPFPISGRFVVHSPATTAKVNDPSLAYKLAPFETKQYADFLASAGASGSGSVDVVAAVGSAPVIVTTIADTHSMATVQVPLVDPASALSAGTRGVLVAPADPARTRFNIGIRTLGDGAGMTISVRDASGAELRSVARPFPASYFQQFSAEDLTGAPLGANHTVVITVDAGSAIVYGAAIDNATGDTSLQIARRVSE